MKTVHVGAALILDAFLSLRLTLLITPAFGIRDRIVAQPDDPKLGTPYSPLIIFSVRVTCEARRLVRSLALLEILRPYGFSAETINELACPPQCGWVSG